MQPCTAPARRFLQKLDGYALLLVMANNLGLFLYSGSGRRAASAAATAAAGSTGDSDVRWGILLTLVLAAVQYVLLLQRADICRKHRHSLAIGNRSAARAGVASSIGSIVLGEVLIKARWQVQHGNSRAKQVHSGLRKHSLCSMQAACAAQVSWQFQCWQLQCYK
jgi:hypothetical protein